MFQPKAPAVTTFTILLAVLSYVTAKTHAVTVKPCDILVTDVSTASLILLDPMTGAQTIISSGGSFRNLYGAAIHPNSTVYVVDQIALGGSIFLVDLETGVQHVVSSDNNFRQPFGLAIEADGSIVTSNAPGGSADRVVRVDPNTGGQAIVSSGGLFIGPSRIALESDGSILVSDDGSSGPGGVIRVNPVTGEQTRVSWGGQFVNPYGIAVETDGSIVVADEKAGMIIRVDPVSGAQTVLASGLNRPTAIAVDPCDGTILVNKPGGINRVNKVTGATVAEYTGGYFPSGLLTISSIAVFPPPPDPTQQPVANAGEDQSASEGQLVTLDGSTSSDPNNDPLVYRWKQVSGPNVTLSGGGSVHPSFVAPPVRPGCAVTLEFQLTVSDGLLTSSPDTVRISAVHEVGVTGLKPGDLLVTDVSTATLILIDRATGSQTLISRGDKFQNLYGVALDKDKKIFVVDQIALGGSVFQVDLCSGGQTIISSGGSFREPFGLAFEKDGRIVTSNAPGDCGDKVIRVNPATGCQTIVSQNSFFPEKFFEGPARIAVAPDRWIYVSDTGDHNSSNCSGTGVGGQGRIIRIDPGTGEQKLISQGQNLLEPYGIAIEDNCHAVVADPRAKKVVRVNLITGEQTVVASRLDPWLSSNSPGAIAVDPDGSLLVNIAGGILRLDRDTGAQIGSYTGGMLVFPSGIVVVPGEPDLAPPVVTLSSPADGTVTSAAEINVVAQVSDQSATSVLSVPAGLSGCLPPGGGTITGTVPLATEGPNVVSVTATDAADNAGGTSITITRDTVFPLLAVNSPPDGAILGISPAAVTASVSDASATTVTFGSNSVSLPAGGGVASGPVDLVEGENTLLVKATDAAGNTTSLTHTLILDLTAPVVTITSPATNACFGPGASLIAVTATIDDLTATTVTSTPDGVAASLPAGGGIATGAVTLAEGFNTISISATDAAGRTGSDAITVLLDSTPPEVHISSPASGASIRGTIDFDAQANDSLPGSPGTGVHSVELLVDGVSRTVLAAAPYESRLDTTALSDGTHELEAIAADGKGNISRDAILIQVDNTPPHVAILAPLGGAFVRGTIPFDVEASDGGSGLASVVLLAGGVPPTIDPSATYGTPVASAALHGEEDTTRSPDGPLAFKATVRDAAGNEASVLATVQVDNTAPKKTLLSPVDASTVSGVIAIAVEVTDEPNLGTIEIFVDGVSLGTSRASPFSVSFDTTSRLDGAMSVRVVVTDLAGNSSTCTANVTVDNIAVVLHPETLNLKSKSKERSVTALLEGVNVGLLLPTEDKAIFLCVPGGNPIPSTAGFAGDDEAPDDDDDDEGIPKLVIKFDRQQLIASIRAGISAGQIAPNSNVTVTLKAGGGFVIGTDVIRVKGQ